MNNREAFDNLLLSLGYVSKDLYSKYEMCIAFEVYQAAKAQDAELIAELVADLQEIMNIHRASKWHEHGRYKAIVIRAEEALAKVKE